MLVFKFPSNLPLGRAPGYANRRETDDNLRAVEKSVKIRKGKEKVMVGSAAKSSGNSNGIKGKEIAGSSIMSGSPRKNDTSLEEFPEGYMGKMLVYKSGAVKFKLGDIMYNVSHFCPASCFLYFPNPVSVDTSFLLEFMLYLIFCPVLETVLHASHFLLRKLYRLTEGRGSRTHVCQFNSFKANYQ